MAKIIDIIKERGISYTIKKAVARLKSSKIPNIDETRKLFAGKSGLEIGGPSKIFGEKGFIPIYDVIKGLDGCNFSTSTLWEGEINSDLTYNYHKNKTGTQFILEASDLKKIPDESYDFIISSHCLEHTANPVKAVKEWLRVIKNGAPILLVLPNKDYCFDHKRQHTPFSHLLEDFKKNTGEDDLTHLDEILRDHDLSMDKPAGSLEQFKARSLKNFENRALHQHVFSIDSLKKIYQFLNIPILHTYEDENLIIIGTKTI